MARAISFDRLVILNFLKILLRCAFDVCGERESFCAISLLLRPWRMHAMISCSLPEMWLILPFWEMDPVS